MNWSRRDWAADLIRCRPALRRRFRAGIAILTASVVGQFAVLPGDPAAAREIRIATWNVLAGTTETLEQRASELAGAGLAIAPDILVVQEITGLDTARRLAELLGLGPVHIAISDFSGDEGEWFSAFEIAVISKLPIRAVEAISAHYDSEGPEFAPLILFPDGARRAGKSKPLVVPDLAGLEAMGREPRGVLRVEIDTADAAPLVIYGVHLKSNGVSFCRNVQDDLTAAYGLSRAIRSFPGGEQLRRKLVESLDEIRAARSDANEAATPEIADGHRAIARQRERTVAAIGRLAAIDIADGAATVLVAGDFNTPLSEACVSGSDLASDVAIDFPCRRERVQSACAGQDGYDDTHALLRDGLAGGAKMRVLTAKLGRSFVARDGFPDSPIDNIYVAGHRAEAFTVAVRVGREARQSAWSRAKRAYERRARVFGSDHYPIVTTLQLP